MTTILEPGIRPHDPMAIRLWRRQLDRYPGTRARYTYLAIVVLAAIMLYYELYVQGSVAPSILRDFNMSFRYYVYIIAVGNIFGAAASLIAGLADRWGRANLVAYGLALTAGLMFALPAAPDRFTFGILFTALSFVEGIILVATPALVRDFSPQLGRASAMGFWTLGPVLGSLIVAVVSSNTLNHLPAWRDQFYICGAAGIVVFVVALVGLRELAPNLRDQIMHSVRDRSLIEARARGLDVAAATAKPWRQMLRPDIVGSAFAISVFLLVYYSAVVFLIVYLTTVFGFSEKDANGLGNWLWGFEAIALVAVGLASDRLRVRKPFMLVGAIGAATMTVIFLRQAGHQPSYYHLAMIMTVQAIFLGIAYAPWMASFTETIEAHNPALAATGLAVWGWILRTVVAVAFFIVPVIVSSATPLVRYGTETQAAAARVGPSLLATVQSHQALFNQLARYPDQRGIPPALLATAVKEVGVNTLLAANKVRPELAFLAAHGTAVQTAKRETPAQWKRWWWVCVGGELAFIPFIFVMAGEWSPRRARERDAAHEAAVRAELARLVAAGESPTVR